MNSYKEFFLYLYWKWSWTALSINDSVLNDRLNIFLDDYKIKYDNYVTLLNKEYNNDFNLLNNDISTSLYEISNRLIENRKFKEFLSFDVIDNTTANKIQNKRNYILDKYIINKRESNDIFYISFDIKKALLYTWDYFNIPIFELWDSYMKTDLLKGSYLYINFLNNNRHISQYNYFYPYYNMQYFYTIFFHSHSRFYHYMWYILLKFLNDKSNYPDIFKLLDKRCITKYIHGDRITFILREKHKNKCISNIDFDNYINYEKISLKPHAYKYHYVDITTENNDTFQYYLSWDLISNRYTEFQTFIENKNLTYANVIPIYKILMNKPILDEDYQQLKIHKSIDNAEIIMSPKIISYTNILK